MWYAWETFGGWTVYHVHGQLYNGAPRLNVPGGCYKRRDDAEALAKRLNQKEPEAFKLLDAKSRKRWL
jgi:hypothetical protein